MGFTKEESGEYIGYTQGSGQPPTLYFENGRLTQEHPHADNVGWHPLRNRQPNHVRINATLELGEVRELVVISDNLSYEEAENAIKSIRSKRRENIVKKNKKNLEEKLRKFDSESRIRLYEFLDEDGTIRKPHPSRGHLVRPLDDDFNDAYNEDYAFEQLSNANLAENEIRRMNN
ncbi:hypothetical protein FNH22_19025 [Fulvivirga sp. M361]|uniref:hypothetical protein n=1 Tax=Fulvivirga sp. M361 TaxID=2594266 RepID=UPI00117ACB14|nr:hypothetical protein [Fulvivirga sp. M361]TRX54848.1 hypothetical protein FNH22_19025 [Fulvivirga sp. M361]